MNRNKIIKVIYVGYSGFPIGLAQVQRQLLLSKGLVEAGCQVTVLSRFGIHKIGEGNNIPPQGIYEGIQYIYCSGNPYRLKSFIVRNILKLKGLMLEAYYIRNIFDKRDKNFLIITTNTFYNILYYFFLGKLFGIHTIIDSVEYWSSFKKGRFNKFFATLYDKYYFNFADKIIVISDFLFDKIKQKIPYKSIIKIPAICDFSKFDYNIDNNASDKKNHYFLYCGSANYSEIVLFILRSYARIETGIKLILIISGNKSNLEKIKNYIYINQLEKVTIKSNIPYNDLIALYKNSLALLIPLRSTMQDIARFPHKLGEYTAASRPIVSTNIGEVANYFKDGQNAYLATTYDEIEFSQKLVEIEKDKKKADEVGRKAYLTGLEYFDYKKNAIKLYQFLLNET